MLATDLVNPTLPRPHRRRFLLEGWLGWRVPQRWARLATNQHRRGYGQGILDHVLSFHF